MTMRSDSSQFRSLNEVISGVIIKLQNENLQTRNGQTTNPSELESGKNAKENRINEVTASKKLAKLESARKAVKLNTTWTGHARQKAHEFLLRHGTAAEKTAAKNFLGVIADVKD